MPNNQELAVARPARETQSYVSTLTVRGLPPEGTSSKEITAMLRGLGCCLPDCGCAAQFGGALYLMETIGRGPIHSPLLCSCNRSARVRLLWSGAA